MCNTSLIHIHKIDDPFFLFSTVGFQSLLFVLLSGLLEYSCILLFWTFVVPGVSWTDFNFLLSVNLVILCSPASILC